jgi:hypothetical protein
LFLLHLHPNAQAWSEIVNSMIPRRDVLVKHLEHFASIVEATEVRDKSSQEPRNIPRGIENSTVYGDCMIIIF